MYFPLIERRNSGSDRRTRNENAQSIHKECRHGNDRRQLKLDKDTLLYYASHHLQDTQQDSKIVKALKLFILPVLLAFGGSMATWYIAKQQIESANIIAKQQQKSSLVLDEGQRENAKKIADAQISAQYLVHMRDIFEYLLTVQDTENPKNLEELKQKIRSMAVYGDDALPFLLQIEEHFKNTAFQSYETSIELNTAAKDTIVQIITGGQLNLKSQILVGQKNSRLNLRRQHYENINFRESTFKYANLFSASFKGSSLQQVTFEEVDLQEANFEAANLEGATFKNADIKQTNFRNALLHGASCNGCRNIASAFFTFNQLFYKSKSELFTDIQPKEYVRMFLPYTKEIERKAKSDDRDSDIFKTGGKLFELNIKDIKQLKNHLQTLSQESDIKTNVASHSILAFN